MFADFKKNPVNALVSCQFLCVVLLLPYADRTIFSTVFHDFNNKFVMIHSVWQMSVKTLMLVGAAYTIEWDSETGVASKPRPTDSDVCIYSMFRRDPEECPQSANACIVLQVSRS